MITIKALLFKGFNAYLPTGNTKHAIKAAMRGHSMVVLLACPKIIYKLAGAC